MSSGWIKVSLACFGAWLASAGCRQVLDLNGYSEQSAGAGTAGSEACDSCEPTQCVPFDNTRLSKLGSDGSRPDLPPPSAAGGAPATVMTPATAGDSGQPGVEPCGSLSNPVFVVGSSAAKAFLARFGGNLAATDEMTIVYQSAGSCVGVDAVVNKAPMLGEASYWAGPEDERKCALEDDGAVVDLGISDVFAKTCPQLSTVSELPSDFQDDLGPVQTMGFVVPASSPETAISRDAAYFVYGFGSDSGFEPFTDESSILQRNASSGTQSLIATVIGVDANRFRGTMNKSSDDLVARLVSLGRNEESAARAIGILVDGDVENHRAQIRLLPFQDSSQSCGYYPDSSPTSADKQNVRDGHYPIWGPLHFLTRKANSRTQRLISYLTGTASIRGLDLIQVYVQSGVLPRCAMRVTRATDGGRIEPYQPANPCGCYFEQQATGSTHCQACTTLSECPASASQCSLGFCER